MEGKRGEVGLTEVASAIWWRTRYALLSSGTRLGKFPVGGGKIDMTSLVKEGA